MFQEDLEQAKLTKPGRQKLQNADISGSSQATLTRLYSDPMVALSSLAKILGEYSTIHSPPPL